MSSPLASRSARASALVASLALASAFAAAPARSSDSEARALRGDGCHHDAPRVYQPRPSSVRIGTYNIRAAVSPRTFAAGVRAVLPSVDILGLQEINSKDKARKLAAIRRSGPWDFWRQYRRNVVRHRHAGGAEQTPVLWRSDRFTCTYAGPMLASGLISLRGELPRYDDDKRHWFTVVHLVDRISGQRIAIVNVHLIQGAVKAGRPVPHLRRHWAIYKTQMTNLIQKVQRQQGYGRVFITGDFNAGWVADERHRHRHLPFRSFRHIGYRSMWATDRPKGDRGTHRDALIDQVFSRQRASSARVLFSVKRYSDHRPAVARYGLSAAR